MYIYFYWHGLGWKGSQDSQGGDADFLVLHQGGLEIWSGSKTAKQIALIFQVFPLEMMTVPGHSLAPNKAPVEHLCSFRGSLKEFSTSCSKGDSQNFRHKFIPNSGPETQEPRFMVLRGLQPYNVLFFLMTKFYSFFCLYLRI